MAFRYNNENYLFVNDNDGTIRITSERHMPKDESIIIPMEEALKKIYCIKNYREFIRALEKEDSLKFRKKYINIMSDGYLFVTRVINNVDELPKVLFAYKYECKEFEDLLKLMLNGTASVCESSMATGNCWIGNPLAIQVMFTAEKLKSEGIVLFEKHHKRKKNGKIRIYYAPNEIIKEDLRALNDVLTSVYDGRNADFQVAYKKGKSVYDNATIHKNHKFVYNIDLKDFYPSCKRELVARYTRFLFKGALNTDGVLGKFLDYILIDGGLFIGNPISGCIANTIISKPVRYIKNMCKKSDMEFSVYADDMSFSSDKFISKDYIIEVFNGAFDRYGMMEYFKLNEEKCVGYSGCRRKVTGVSINDSNKVTCSTKYFRLLRAMIAHVAAGDDKVDIGKLRGKIAYATMVDDSGKVYRYLKKFETAVHEHKLCSDEKMLEMKSRFEN